MTTRWKNATAAGLYLGNTSRRFVLREVRAGRLRAARIGGRGEVITCDEWLDEYVMNQAQPVPIRKRA